MKRNNMIIGHKTQWEFLKRIAENRRIPQAFLFAGQNHLGKQRVALEFIKLLNCEVSQQNFGKRKEKPCQKCFSCQSIEKERYPDLTILRPQKKEIQISQIRDLRNALNLGSQISSIKSVIIEEAETMNKEAQNCLLKTLEEPKGKTLFFLISSKWEMLAETIISRSQILKFYPLRPLEIEECFKGKVPPSFLKRLVFLSEGLPGKAIEFFKNPDELEKELKRYQLWQKILDTTLGERFYYLNQLFNRKGEFSQNLDSFLEILLRYLRILWLEKLGLKKNNLSFSFFSQRTHQDYSLPNLKRMIEACQNLRWLISQTNINPKLALENLMLLL